MLIENKKTFLLVTSSENTFSNFFDAFVIDQKKFEKENIVVQVSDTIKATTKDLFSFLNIAKQKNKMALLSC